MSNEPIRYKDISLPRYRIQALLAKVGNQECVLRFHAESLRESIIVRGTNVVQGEVAVYRQSDPEKVRSDVEAMIREICEVQRLYWLGVAAEMDAKAKTAVDARMKEEAV